VSSLVIIPILKHLLFSCCSSAETNKKDSSSSGHSAVGSEAVWGEKVPKHECFSWKGNYPAQAKWTSLWRNWFMSIIHPSFCLISLWSRNNLYKSNVVFWTWIGKRILSLSWLYFSSELVPTAYSQRVWDNIFTPFACLAVKEKWNSFQTRRVLFLRML